MKTEELMIADWVRSTIDPDEVWQWEARDYVDIDEGIFEPIPLTKDILELNGWKDLPLAYVKHIKTDWGMDTINLEKHDKVNYPVAYVVNRLIAIKSVHELQHLLRSCGHREIADNLKIK